MSFIELFFLAVGLSMDAFAVAVCAGLSMPKASINKAFVIGLYFGLFQAVMPVIGYMAATLFADKIIAFDHWVAFVLLCFLGIKMVLGSLKKEGPTRATQGDGSPVLAQQDLADVLELTQQNRPLVLDASVKPSKMLPLALATSIDALAVGVSFAFLKVNIIPAVIFIGITTFAFSITGVKIGNIFGIKFKSKAELMGGIILILIGVKILYEHIII